MDISLNFRTGLATLLAVFILAPDGMLAQNNPLNENHVTWDYLTPTLEGEPGETVVFKFRANLKPKVHLYTQKNYPDTIFGPTPTEMSTGGSKLLKRAGGLKANKGAVKEYDPNFETETAFWKGAVTFSVPFKISESAEPGATEEGFVNLYYQTCDDNSCKPPLDSKFTFKVKILEPESVGIDTAATIDSIHRAIASTNAKALELIDRIVTQKSAPVAGGDSGEGDEPVAASSGDDDEGDSDDDPDASVSSSDTPVAGGGDGGDKGDGEMAAVGGEQEDAPLTVREEVNESIDKGIWAYLALAMGFGLIALATPCVFPMIPITISFFTKREQNNRAQAIRDASVYGLGIIFTFTALGTIVAAIYGAAGVGLIATNPWINLLIAGIFLAFALSLFGLFEIQVPSGILNKLNAKANSGGGVMSILLMGFVFSLTSFTCTVPFVGTVLAGVGEGADWFWPIIGMLAFSAVFALPFFLLALFPSWLKAMPKSGGWLNAVKVTMGFVEIAAAMKFLSNTDLVWDWGILTRELVLAVWIAVAILASIYLLGRFRLPHDAPMEKVGVIRMLFSMGFLAIGLWMLTGLFGGRLGEIDAFLPPQEYPGKGNTSILASIHLQNGPGGGAAADADPLKANRVMAEGMEWVLDDYEDALVVAKETGKPLFVDFTGYTCTNCRWMEVNVFTKADVQELMREFVLVRLYTDRREESNTRNRQMQIDRFQTIDLPYYVIISPDDVVLGQTVFTRDVDFFKSFLQRGIAAVKGKKGTTEDVAAR